MDRNLFLNLIITLLISLSASAQKNKIHFHSINSFGLIGGESEVSIAYQTVNGIRFSNWFSGVGVGVDNYRYKTLPLFFDARWYFGSEKKAFFYGDLGYNFPMKNKLGKEMIYFENYHFKGGLYSELGMGFKTKFIKKSSILFGFAYSNKQLQSQAGIVPLCSECNPIWYNYKLSYGRVLLKTGIEF
jgi:hypothetical protein